MKVPLTRVSFKKGKSPLWLVSYADLMTLLLCFVLLLVSMSVISERNKRGAIKSVSSHFGLLAMPTQVGISQPVVAHDNKRKSDFSQLKPLLLYHDEGLDFFENQFVQTISINAEILFQANQATLTQRGTRLLDVLFPYIDYASYPILIEGHTAPLREEKGSRYTAQLNQHAIDSSWDISYQRANSVSTYLVSKGISPLKISVEAFGQFHPRYSNRTPAGRKKNMRVDLVIDKRAMEWIKKDPTLFDHPKSSTTHYFRGFKFDLLMP